MSIFKVREKAPGEVFPRRLNIEFITKLFAKYA